MIQKACNDGDEERVKYLLDGVTSCSQLLKRNACAETALHCAINSGSEECVLLLLNHPNIEIDLGLYKELMTTLTDVPQMTTVRKKLFDLSIAYNARSGKA